MKKTLIAVGLALLSIYNVQAQCITDEVNHKFEEEHPEHVIDPNTLTPGHRNTRRATKYVIPVVFHVVHTNGPENISKEQIDDQMRILNEDFSFTNANKSNIRSIFLGLAADCEIEFRLAKIDGNNNCFDGIHRVYNVNHQEVRDEVKTAVPGWNYKKYLNIWVVSSINSNGEGTTLGYAYLPFSTNQSVDGIVMRSDAVGSIGTARADIAGRTLTHEVGHWLGLRHPFQGGCNNSDLTVAKNLNLCDDDTPPVASTFTNANCNPNTNSCSTENPDLPDMYENFMDYSKGTCQSMFTDCQKKLMHYVLDNSVLPRKNLHSLSNLIATGVEAPSSSSGKPVAHFSSTARVVCQGQPVQLFDESCLQLVDSRLWTLSGSSIASTNSKNPIVTYATPGLYKVSLKVANAYGDNTKTIADYIEVLPNVGRYLTIEEGFESATFSNPGWTLYEHGSIKWERTAEASYNGGSSFKAAINSSTPNGTRFQCDLPAVDLRPLVGMNPKISFMVGYKKANADKNEILRLYISTDCGENFEQRYLRQGSGLSTTAASQANFIPSSQSDWRRLDLPLFEYENDSNVIIRLEVESASGNSVYIDNINISQFYTGVDEFTVVSNLDVYPNPNNGNMKLDLELTKSSNVKIDVIDAVGRKVMHVYDDKSTGGLHTFEINNKNGVITSGIYTVRVEIDGAVYFRKISVAN
jgi:PKD repeat protein